MKQQKLAKILNRNKTQVFDIVLLMIICCFTQAVTAREYKTYEPDTVDSYYLNEAYCNLMLTNPLSLYEKHLTCFDGFYCLHYNGNAGKITFCDRNSDTCQLDLIIKNGIKYVVDPDKIELYRLVIQKNILFLYPINDNRNSSAIKFIASNIIDDKIWQQKEKLGIVNLLLFATYLKNQHNYNIIKKLHLAFPYTLDRHLVWGNIMIIHSFKNDVWLIDQDAYAIRIYKYLNLSDLILSDKSFNEANNAKLRLKKTFKHNRSITRLNDVDKASINNKTMTNMDNNIYYINSEYKNALIKNMQDFFIDQGTEMYGSPVLQTDQNMSFVALLDQMGRCLLYEKNNDVRDTLISSQCDKEHLIYSFIKDTLFVCKHDYDTVSKDFVSHNYKYTSSSLINNDVWEQSDPWGIINLRIIAEYFLDRYQFDIIQNLHLKYPYTYHTYTGLNNINLITSNRWDCNNVWSVEIESNQIKLFKCNISHSDSLIEKKELKYVIK